MQFTITHESPAEHKSDCIIVGVYKNGQLSSAAQQLNAASDGFIQQVIEQNMTGQLEETLLLHQCPKVATKRILLVGCGSADNTTANDFRKIIQGATKQLLKLKINQLSCYLLDLTVEDFSADWCAQEAIIAMREVLYQFSQCKATSKEKSKHSIQLDTIYLGLMAATTAETAMNSAIQHGQAIAQGIDLAKNLANLPGNICTPSYLSDQAQQLVKRHPQLKLKVIEEDEMQRLNMGAFLSVSKGSKQPAKLIVIEYQGLSKDKAQKPYALVGKGVTFDAGGISLKPANAMDEMKFDMCGAASVFGALEAIAEMKLPLNVVGLMACSENLPGGQASKPGDIVTTMSGHSVEILNTDAEGRLVLCDTLSYVQKEYQPQAIVDIATLTGAIIVALGHHISGLMSNDDQITDDLIKAGQQTNDLMWRLPMDDDFNKLLDSNFADIANISSGRGAGSITAACFLSRFIEDTPWAHLDIAGIAWKSGKAKGATGRPVAALVQYLVNRAKQA